MDGIHVYRHPMAQRRPIPLPDICCEYGGALFWEFLYAWWIYLRRGFHVIQGCNPPDNIFLVALSFKLWASNIFSTITMPTPNCIYRNTARRTSYTRCSVRLEKMTYRSSDVVMVTNASYRGLAINRGLSLPENVFMVRNGPNLETFRPCLPTERLKDGKAYWLAM